MRVKIDFNQDQDINAKTKTQTLMQVKINPLGPRSQFPPDTPSLTRGHQPQVSLRHRWNSETVKDFVKISAFCSFVSIYCRTIFGFNQDRNQ